jgi:hypothetical protein
MTKDDGFLSAGRSDDDSAFLRLFCFYARKEGTIVPVNPVLILLMTSFWM